MQLPASGPGWIVRTVMDKRDTNAGAGSLFSSIRNYDWVTYRQLLTPKLVTTLRSGYTANASRPGRICASSKALSGVSVRWLVSARFGRDSSRYISPVINS